MTAPEAPPRQTPVEPASGVAGDQVPAVEGGPDLAAGRQDGARSVPEPPAPPPPPGADFFVPGFPSRPPPPPRRPSRLTHPSPERRLLTWFLNLFGRRRRAWALRMEKWQHDHQVVAIDPTGKLPGRTEALEAVAGAARRYVAGPAEPSAEELLLNLTAAIQLLDAVEAHNRERLREALASQP